jgi:microcystin-dependent protein
MTRKSLRTALLAGAAAAVLATTLQPKPAQACDSNPFIAGVCVFAGTFAPRGWAFTNGQLLAVSSNEALFSLIGTTYGGDGRTTFGLPDTRGRAVIGAGQGPGLPTNYPLGNKGGQETVVLNTLQLPSHNHTVAPDALSTPGNADVPTGAVPAQVAGTNLYSTATPDVSMRATASSNTGGSNAHENRSPFLAMQWVIALQGVYPSRN